jgi:hypothetical protein
MRKCEGIAKGMRELLVASGLAKKPKIHLEAARYNHEERRLRYMLWASAALLM